MCKSAARVLVSNDIFERFANLRNKHKTGLVNHGKVASSAAHQTGAGQVIPLSIFRSPAKTTSSTES